MNKRTVLGLALRIVAVCCLAYALFSPCQHAASFLSRTSRGTPRAESPVWVVLLGESVVAVFLLGAGVILLVYPDAIAGRLLRSGRRRARPDSTGWQQRIFVLSLRVVGIIFGLKIVPAALQSLYPGLLLGRLAKTYDWCELAVGVIVLPLAFYLFFDGRGLIRLAFRTEREGGDT